MNKTKKAVKKVAKKPAKKEPKFKVGDWWKDGMGKPHQIIQIASRGECPIRAQDENWSRYTYTREGVYLPFAPSKWDLVKKIKPPKVAK